MNYCINPKCLSRQNPDNLAVCQSCHTPLLVNNRYRLIKPLRELDEFSSTEIFEVDDGGTLKVMKILKRPKLLPMFQREARILQQLRHPGIPKVEPDGYFKLFISGKELHCLVMEKIDGYTLEEWLNLTGKISQKIAINWLIQILDILKIIHENNLFHRDIKPSNIMLRPNGQLVLIDFGTVREITSTYLAKVGGSERYITGIISPGYTPQEQAIGKAVPQSDFFALGRTFVHLLTEKHPIDLPEDTKTGELIWQQKAPQISPALAELIDEMMAPFPGKRPASAQMILQRLERLKQNQGNTGKPASWLLTGMILIWLGITSLGGWRNAMAVYYYNRGLEYHLARQAGEAETYYKRALQLNPKYAEVYNALGFLCQEQENIDCARKNYEKAITLQPSLAIAHFNLGVVCEEQQDWECAKIAYQQASKSLPAASNNQARLHILNKEYEKAVTLLSEAILQAKDEQTKYAIMKNWGWALLGQKKYQEAKEKLKSALAIQEKKAPAYCLLAQVWEAEGKIQAAQVEWKNCIRYASRYNPDEATWIEMARLRLNAGGNEK